MKLVTLAECVWCGSLTVNPLSDKCECGNDLYPSVKTLRPGQRIFNTQLNQVGFPPEPITKVDGKIKK